MQRGGIRAVAIATPEMTVPCSLRLFSTMPAAPPKKAISTSNIVGLVRASSSVGSARFSGDRRKKRQDAVRLIKTIVRRFLNDSFIRLMLFVPIDRPTPSIGPMTGEMSMAPIMTAVEFTFSPTDAMMMAKVRIHTFAPRNQIPLRIRFSAPAVSRSPPSWETLLKNSFILKSGFISESSFRKNKMFFVYLYFLIEKFYAGRRKYHNKRS